jgi:uncharacterized phiE125 gp8 family phage protein
MNELVLKTPPTESVLALSEVKEFLHLTAELPTEIDPSTYAENVTLKRIMATVEEAAQKYQNRAYLPQVWQLILDDWPEKDFIELGITPVRSIVSITYTDSDNVAHTFAAASYFLDTTKKPPRVCLGYGETWPSDTLKPSGAIVVEFNAGFADLDTYRAKMNYTTDQWLFQACNFLFYNRDKTLKDFPFDALKIDRVGGWFA